MTGDIIPRNLLSCPSSVEARILGPLLEKDRPLLHFWVAFDWAYFLLFAFSVFCPFFLLNITGTIKRLFALFVLCVVHVDF